jgi:hypothetical protein
MYVELWMVTDDLRSDFERAIYNVLQATLKYPANPQAKSAKVADDIIFLCT